MKYSKANHFIREMFGYLLVILVIMLSIQSAYAERLYVFYPSTQRTQLIQKKLTSLLPNIEILVFGRYKDFKSKTKADSPEAILSKIPVIEYLKNYVPKLKGSREGNIKENYVFLSVAKNINPNNMTGMTIGIFDILGRKGMKKLMGNYFTPIPKLKRVSKMEDLLQLLTFNMVDAVLIPEIHVKYFKEISKLDFVITPVLTIQQEIITLAIRKNAMLDLNIFTNMGSKILLEIDSWEAR